MKTLVIIAVILLALVMGFSTCKASENYTIPKDWVSPEELRAFLAFDDTNIRAIIIANSKGEIWFSGQCEDLAMQLRDRAALKGKHLSIVPINQMEQRRWWHQFSAVPQYLKPRKLDYYEYHAICGAIIGNDYYYIEPRTDKMWDIADLD